MTSQVARRGIPSQMGVIFIGGALEFRSVAQSRKTRMKTRDQGLDVVCWQMKPEKKRKYPGRSKGAGFDHCLPVSCARTPTLWLTWFIVRRMMEIEPLVRGCVRKSEEGQAVGYKADRGKQCMTTGRRDERSAKDDDRAP